MFSMQSVSLNPFIATFQSLSAASLNLVWSQNAVTGNGLKGFFLRLLTVGIVSWRVWPVILPIGKLLLPFNTRPPSLSKVPKFW